MTLRGSTRTILLGLLAGVPSVTSAASERPLPLVVAVGPEIRTSPEWRQDLGRATAYCQEALGEAVAGRFRVREIVPWQPHGSTLEAMLASLRQQVPPRAGALVVGLTRRRAVPENEWGLSSYREALTLVTTARPGRRYGPALAHEMVHVFGGVHVDLPGHVMNTASPGSRLSPINAALLKLHRDRSLSPHRFPLSPARLREARELYREAAASAPQALAFDVRLALESGDDRGALRGAERLVAISGDPQAQMLRGIALGRLGRREAALEAYGQALRSGPGDADVHYNRAVALEADDDAAAEAGYREALRRDASHVPALSSLARLLARTGRADEALDVAGRAVSLAPEYTPARVNLALARLRGGDPERALEASLQALELDPECPEALALQGAALLTLARPREALAALERGADLDPRSVELWEGLGRARRELGDREGARRALEHALSLAPNRTSAHVELGLALLGAGRAREAADSFEHAATLEPERLSAWTNLAAARLLQGRAADAEAACRRALKLEPDAPRALTTLGLVRSAQGRQREALDLQQRAAGLAPNDPDVLGNLADLYLEQGRREEARDLYTRVLERRPGDAFAHNNLAVLLYRLGDVGGAAEHASRAQELGVAVAPAFLRVLDEKLASR